MRRNTLIAGYLVNRETVYRPDKMRLITEHISQTTVKNSYVKLKSRCVDSFKTLAAAYIMRNIYYRGNNTEMRHVVG